MLYSNGFPSNLIGRTAITLLIGHQMENLPEFFDSLLLLYRPQNQDILILVLRNISRRHFHNVIGSVVTYNIRFVYRSMKIVILNLLYLTIILSSSLTPSFTPYASVSDHWFFHWSIKWPPLISYLKWSMIGGPMKNRCLRSL